MCFHEFANKIRFFKIFLKPIKEGEKVLAEVEINFRKKKKNQTLIYF